MKLKLIIVEPKYQINLGYIARVSMNFGIDRLHIVKPRAQLYGKTAIMYSKHAYPLLKNAKVYGDFGAATSDCDILIGTTGVLGKAKSSFRNVYLIDGLIKKLKGVARRSTTVGLVIGRDDIGLTKEELELCDLIAYINTNEKYPVLNISHALAIFLFALTSGKIEKRFQNILTEQIDRNELKAMFRLFDRLIENKRIRDKKSVRIMFKRIISTAQPTRREIHALITALK